nr:immunoglobulin light chain junction region [Macaca mulatta]MOW40722.1 immunoglobulin light chain junction region [Macaca mulatta]MOW40844.1 immunoglobulin light chain junction region [Macaca mulatta]MOW40865.1 immunoglobulin light chain junction region [Macaca mulatta]MOW40867.1 immunoglobulin light chain junction region [Macaca mulatta]
CMQALEYPWTF